jgi:hypothetical protein
MVLAILLALICGTQLWSKKILTDPGAAAALAPAPITGTIAQLGGFPRTHKRQSYMVDGIIIEAPKADLRLQAPLPRVSLLAPVPAAGTTQVPASFSTGATDAGAGTQRGSRGRRAARRRESSRRVGAELTRSNVHA